MVIGQVPHLPSADSLKLLHSILRSVAMQKKKKKKKKSIQMIHQLDLASEQRTPGFLLFFEVVAVVCMFCLSRRHVLRLVYSVPYYCL